MATPATNASPASRRTCSGADSRIGGGGGLSAFCASSDDEIDDLAFDRLHQFGVLRVYRVADLEAAGFELVPTFRTPHVTVAWASDLDEGLGRFASARHQERGNPYHERDRPEDRR